MPETKRCYYCIPHRIGVTILFFMLLSDIPGIYWTFCEYGSKGKLPMIIMLTDILIMAGIIFNAVIYPGKATASGRYAVWWFWTFFDAIGMNCFWWFMVWNNVWPDGNVAEWECDKTLTPGTNAYDACVTQNQWDNTYPSLPFFLNDCYIAFELYRWYKDANAHEGVPL